jgi:hypothetical protein
MDCSYVAAALAGLRTVARSLGIRSSGGCFEAAQIYATGLDRLRARRNRATQSGQYSCGRPCLRGHVCPAFRCSRGEIRVVTQSLYLLVSLGCANRPLIQHQAVLARIQATLPLPAEVK